MKYTAIVLLIGLSLCLGACNSDTQPAPTTDNNTADHSTELHVKSEPLSGEQLFFVCQACHSISEGAEHKVGPNLYGIIDQPAASRDGYSYSDALKNSGLAWNKGTLTGWILATENVVPGTWMVYHNHLSPEEVMRLVDYIGAQK